MENNYLVKFQQKLKAPKGQYNNFGKYKYRSCEDIIEAVKPIIHEDGFYLTLSDDMVEIGGRIYVKATASLARFTKETGLLCYTTTAFAREEETKKGMDASQITGAASSYARKYALNGLFAIDDTKDADATNKHGVTEETEPEAEDPRPWMTEKQYNQVLDRINRRDKGDCATIEEFYDKVKATYRLKKHYKEMFDAALNSKFNDIIHNQDA